jgi:predicted Ser/Thr protein kinase
MDRDSEDLLLGKKALDRKLISNGQLKEALIEQARSRTPSGSQNLRLGDVFVARNFLSSDQLRGLQEDNARIASAAAPGRDSAFGRILVENRAITAVQLQECLRIQDEALRTASGPEPRLGELLVAKGYATPDAVRHALAIQEKTILKCSGCDKRCNGAGYDPSRKYLCPSCKAELRPVAGPAEIAVQEITQDVPFADLPGATPQPGRILGKYTIVREVGRGGMGVVFEALDTTLNRKVALKMLVMRPQAIRTDEERFLREAKLSAGLPNHPNVVGVYEAGILDGNRYLAMEFIDGVPMFEWWKDKSIRLRTQVTVLRDASLGAHHAHQHGVIHRDLKPENILIDRAGQPHITDFGLAKDMRQNPKDALTGVGMVVGSPHYMSPEQVRGLRVDRRADVYSLGVILYEMFTGRRPFDGGSPEEIMLKALKSSAPSPSSIMRSQMNPVLHRSLENVCLKAIAKDPKERYVTAKALADDLGRWLQGEEVQADLPLQRKRRRRSLLATAATAGLLLLVGLGYAALVPSALERELKEASDLVLLKQDYAARAAYERILARWPGQKDALAAREELRRRQIAQRLLEGESLLEQGRPSEAFDAFTRALMEDPRELRALDGRDEAKRRMISSGGSEGKADPKRP